MSKVAALVLAAGTGSRFRALDPTAASKLAAGFRGKALVRHVVEAALRSSADPVLVVTGYAASVVKRTLEGLPVTFIHNERYAEGLASTLQSGVAALPQEATGVVVLLGDMPLVSAETIDRLVEASAGAAEMAVVPVLDGRRGNPVLLPRAMFARLTRLEGDQGARRLLNESSAVLELAVPDLGVAIDIDTPEELAR